MVFESHLTKAGLEQVDQATSELVASFASLTVVCYITPVVVARGHIGRVSLQIQVQQECAFRAHHVSVDVCFIGRGLVDAVCFRELLHEPIPT